MKYQSIAVVALLAASAAPALAQRTMGAGARDASAMSAEVSTQTVDAQFVANLHRANQKEIDLANLAKTTGQSTQVKAFADQMIKEHTAADAELLAVAKAANITVAMTGDAMQAADAEAMMAQFRNLKGADFDKAFGEAMVRDHSQAVQMLEASQTQVQNAQLKTFITKTLPTIREHLTAAQALVPASATAPASPSRAEPTNVPPSTSPDRIPSGNPPPMGTVTPGTTPPGSPGTISPPGTEPAAPAVPAPSDAKVPTGTVPPLGTEYPGVNPPGSAGTISPQANPDTATVPR